MAKLYVHHKVADYAAWRAVFDSMDGIRRSFGQTGSQVFHTANDPNEIVALTEWNSIEDARRYAQSPELKEGMKRAGVVSQPDVLFLEQV